MPWSLREDLAFFKQMTVGNTVVMGRVTYDHLPSSVRPLPNRRNIVVSQTMDGLSETVEVVNSITKALEVAAKGDSRPVFIIGGAKLLQCVFERFLYQIGRAHV